MDALAQFGFNAADWILLTVLLVSTVISLRRGFVKEALSLVTWIVAFVVALLVMGSRRPLLLVMVLSRRRTAAAMPIMLLCRPSGRLRLSVTRRRPRPSVVACPIL